MADPTESAPEEEPAPVIPYEQFLAERRLYIEARQRTEQRTSQMITGGAVGALLLSITFLDTIAPDPAPESRATLIGAWGLLLVALLLEFIATLQCKRALLFVLGIAMLAIFSFQNAPFN